MKLECFVPIMIAHYCDEYHLSRIPHVTAERVRYNVTVIECTANVV